MSSTSSDSDQSSSSDNDSDINYLPGRYPLFEVENDADDDGEDNDETSNIEPYSNEPIADKEWLESYKKRQEDRERRLESLKDRLSGKETVSTW